ncbi:thiamine-phosphate pyrophosphorylase [Cytobacillus firmus]|uniref:thiamine phosphate synthase n=1 Tax=Cytobacillus firmus TaxID=1399 RepID=UPI00077CCF97|nr:thiamine phosphate synthase [Cytobacillus firmus]MBG9542192.1 thiamine-phosphate pyrophosphorylase [Cytobacillus firmus]MBG9553787.1 thiamine-phosphate pyrophosphorylase [Cytobacillus firmus]MBG9557633.1 thiamine-phosphate pyrophosphorylase [Cytobacillus firmus]MBG9573786.1 thiamine-phosphate pyrophosphorylase [Cytobacillus firmus]MEC1892226.1 thiamine phosphate synthase [Cytobacillus firmus]
MAVNPQAMRNLLKVYFIMGSTNCHQDPEKVLQSAIKGGITLFQFREKGAGCLYGKEKESLAIKLQAICKESSIPFIVNDDIELALKINADGVHIGQDDEAADVVRRKIGSKILGVSVHSMQEAETAIRQGADYLGIGPIYPTSTKEDAKAVQGLTFLTELRSADIQIPVVGIGGITSENTPPIIKAGADGVSVISAISQADSPEKAAILLYDAVRE